MGMSILRAPFPYYGYKGQVSEIIWERLGNPPNYVEPFFGSGAVLLQRPGGAGKREVVNDKFGHVANFWRAVAKDPETVALIAAYHFSESDLHARNSFCRRSLKELTSRLEADPDHYDSKLAGYWVYVQCLAIGEAAFADGPWVVEDGRLVCRPKKKGIRRAVPCNSARGIQKSIPFHGKQGLLSKVEFAVEWMVQLSERVTDVRVLCGDWSRAVKPTYTTQHGLTGIYLDPPYDDAWVTYKHASPMAKKIYDWCAESGKDERLRIAISGYSGTYVDGLVELGWSEFAWKSKGGRVTTGGQSDKNRSRERILFSPYCLDSLVGGKQMSLLEGVS